VLSVPERSVPSMDPLLTTEPIPVDPRRLPKWDVLYGGKKIGRIEQERIGRSTSMFFHAFVFVGGKTISLELDTRFEDRCAKILQAWRDPASTPQTRYWLGLEE